MCERHAEIPQLGKQVPRERGWRSWRHVRMKLRRLCKRLERAGGASIGLARVSMTS